MRESLLFALVFMGAVRADAGEARLVARLGEQNSRLAPSGVAMAASPDDARIAVMTYGDVVLILDVSDPAKPRLERRIKTGRDVEGLQFAGERVLVTESKGRIETWDVSSGKRLRVLRDAGTEPDGYIYAKAIAPSSGRLAYATFRSSISIIDTATGDRVAALRPANLDATVMSAVYSPDWRRLAASSWVGEITLWDIDKSTVMWTSQVRSGIADLVSSGVAGHHYGLEDAVREFVFSPNGDTIAAGSRDGRLYLLDSGSGAIRRELELGDYNIEVIAFMPDGRSAVVGDAAGTLMRVDLESGRVLFSVNGAGRIDGISIERTGRWIRTLENDGYVVVRDASTGRPARKDMARTLWSAAIKKDEKTLIATADDGSIEWFDLRTGKAVMRVDPEGGRVYSLELSPDETLMAATDFNRLRIWDSTSGREVVQFQAKRPYSVLSHFAFAPDSKSVYTADSHGIDEWSVKESTRTREFVRVAELIHGIAVSADGRFVAAGCFGAKIYVWDRLTGKERFQAQLSEPNSYSALNVAFAPDSSEVIGLDQNRRELIRAAVPDGRIIERRKYGMNVLGFFNTPNAVAIMTRDGRGNESWTLRSAVTGRELPAPKAVLRDAAKFAAVSPSGRDWVVWSDDGPLSVWRK